MLYVSPDAFRVSRFGNDVSALTDLQLARVLARASTIVEAYCTVPLVPQRHDFRGGFVSGEQHTWRLPAGPASTGVDVATRRVYPFHWPIKAVSAFRIRVANTQIALDITPAEVMVNNTDRYVEVVTLLGASFGVFNAITMPNVFLATPIVELAYEYGHEFAVTDEQLFPVDTARLTYRAENQWWLVDSQHVPVVSVGGVPQSSGRTIDAREGTVTFDTSPGGEPVVVGYTHRLPAEVREAVGLIARFELGQSAIAAKGLMGVETLRMAEIEITQRREPRGSSGALNANNLDRLVPEAADLLSGLKFFRMAA